MTQEWLKDIAVKGKIDLSGNINNFSFFVVECLSSNVRWQFCMKYSKIMNRQNRMGWWCIYKWCIIIMTYSIFVRRIIIVIFITRGSEVIMFSPCVIVCLCVCVYVCHDVCPDDLTMKDWCHTNNILQVHCWGSLVVQVMFHALMTSLMTSQDHKIGQILSWYISVNMWARASIKSSKCRKCSWLYFWYIQLPV